MGRVSAVVLMLSIMLSLTAFAQTTAPASSTGSIPARVNLDPVPPIIYSGNAPLRTSGPDPSVVRPLVTADQVVVNTRAVIGGGGVTYVTEAVAPSGPVISVADAAAQYRTSKAGMKSRVIDNTTLSTLDRNPSGLVSANELTMPQGDAAPEETAAVYNAKPEYAAAGDVLDRRDLAAVEAAIRRSEMQQNAGDTNSATNSADTNGAGSNANDASSQYEQMTQEADAADAAADSSADALPQGDQAEVLASPATSSEAVPQESQATDETQRDRLPESSSALPFIGLLGFIAVAGGAVSMLRARG